MRFDLQLSIEESLGRAASSAGNAVRMVGVAAEMSKSVCGKLQQRGWGRSGQKWVGVPEHIPGSIVVDMLRRIEVSEEAWRVTAGAGVGELRDSSGRDRVQREARQQRARNPK